MTLTDAGPLIALIDKGQAVAHKQCLEAQRDLRGPLLTTWPCLAEAMYLVYRVGGHPAQDELWQYAARGALQLHGPAADEWPGWARVRRCYSPSWRARSVIGWSRGPIFGTCCYG